MGIHIEWDDRINHPDKIVSDTTYEVNAGIMNEIKSVVNQHGWANYNDSASISSPQAIVGGNWEVINNDGSGSQTMETYLPPSVSSLYDFPSQSLNLSEVPVGQVIRLRQDINITPSNNNATLRARLEFSASNANGTPAFSFVLDKRLPRLDEGGSVSYPLVFETSFFIGSSEVASGSVRIMIQCGSNANIVNNGVFVWI